MARIVVIVNTDGTSTVQVSGVTGPSCVNLTKNLQRALGETISDRKSSEYSMVATGPIKKKVSA